MNLIFLFYLSEHKLCIERASAHNFLMATLSFPYLRNEWQNSVPTYQDQNRHDVSVNPHADAGSGWIDITRILSRHAVFAISPLQHGSSAEACCIRLGQ